MSNSRPGRLARRAMIKKSVIGLGAPLFVPRSVFGRAGRPGANADGRADQRSV
jgi:hypothetical protein